MKAVPERKLECKLYIDQAPGDAAPRIGQFVITEGKKGAGSAYLILGVRLVKRRKPSSRVRFNLRCQRAAIRDVVGDPVWMRWYPRERRKPVFSSHTSGR